MKTLGKTERILWIAAVLALTAWGLLARRPPPDAPAAKTATAGGKIAPSRAAAATPTARTSREHAAGRDRSGLATVHTRALAALRSPDPLVRMGEFLQLLNEADADRFDEVARTLAELKASGISLPAEEDLLNFRAGQLKGAGLMAARTTPPTAPGELATVARQYEGWLQADPLAAGRWLDGLPPGRYRDQFAVACIAASALDDPARSLELVASLHPSQQTAAGLALGKRLAEADSQDISSLLKTLALQAGPGDSRYLRTLFDTLAGEATSDTASLLEEHLDRPYVSGAALAKISQEKAKVDPVAALEWAAGMEDRKSDLPAGEMQAAAIRGMDLDGIRQAREWISGQSDRHSLELLKALEKQREILEDRVGEENEYDRDD